MTIGSFATYAKTTLSRLPATAQVDALKLFEETISQFPELDPLSAVCEDYTHTTVVKLTWTSPEGNTLWQQSSKIRAILQKSFGLSAMPELVSMTSAPSNITIVYGDIPAQDLQHLSYPLVFKKSLETVVREHFERTN